MGRNSFLNGKVVGISISESEDILQMGYSKSHLIDANLEIARHLLSCGCTLLYGGDLRAGGFTNLLIELAEAYSTNKSGNVHLMNYLNWPSSQMFKKKDLTKVSDRIKIVKTGLPEDVKSNLRPKDYLEPATVDQFYIWARSLTHMREQINSVCNARIVFGGQIDSYKGKYPGILEEVYLATKSKVPVFVIGAYGGAAFEMSHVILGKKSEKLSSEYQFRKKKNREKVEYFNRNKPSTEEEINFEVLTAHLKNIGLEGLNNGLESNENNVLFKTPHIPEMVSLILKGLTRKFGTDGK